MKYDIKRLHADIVDLNDKRRVPLAQHPDYPRLKDVVNSTSQERSGIYTLRWEWERKYNKDRATLLYSCISHLRGKLHMHVRAEPIYAHGTPMSGHTVGWDMKDWTMEDQAKLVADELRKYEIKESKPVDPSLLKWTAEDQEAFDREE